MLKGRSGNYTSCKLYGVKLIESRFALVGLPVDTFMHAQEQEKDMNVFGLFVFFTEFTRFS